MKRLPFFDLVHQDLERVERLLQEHPPEQNEVINVAIDHLIGGGGKRLRPGLALLSTYLCGADLERGVLAAAALEMLHTATLVHDDLIDGSLMRRGEETLNTRWTPGATVLAGDYIFARAAYLASQTGSVRLTQRFAETLMVICDGEIRQMFAGHFRIVTRQEYERRIHAKTASLLALSSEAGAILAQADEEEVDALRTFGERLGMGFQIVDDVLDFVADEETLGKPVGSDLRHGLFTLPVLLFLEIEPDHPLIHRMTVQHPSDEMVEEVVGLIADSPAVDRALQVAGEYCDQAKAALESFAPGPYRAALLDMADFVVRRRF